ncbi:hypothetical protein [Synechocystis sp. LKSZ1]|uniref:hypothetical protein n=1 Tax=Synechocystis sp. LKSZ1 TaxID=3144951 RepID=UPI00336BF1D8
MLDSISMPFALFNLEGEVLEFDDFNPNKPQFIVLGVEDERVTIKLPKHLSNTLVSQLIRVGHRIACIGKTQIDHSTGLIKMTALQLCLPTLLEEHFR